MITSCKLCYSHFFTQDLFDNESNLRIKISHFSGHHNKLVVLCYDEIVIDVVKDAIKAAWPKGMGKVFS